MIGHYPLSVSAAIFAIENKFPRHTRCFGKIDLDELLLRRGRVGYLAHVSEGDLLTN
jgi:hypothetical protein